MPNFHNIFVYGTLKRGQWNHEWFLSGAIFLGAGQTKQPFAMHDAYGFPTVAESPRIYPIRGEAFAVTDAELAALDRLEQHPRFYTRRQTRIVLDDGQRLDAWLYFGQAVPGYRWMPSGLWWPGRCG